jgi:hypothetical protein
MNQAIFGLFLATCRVFLAVFSADHHFSPFFGENKDFLATHKTG